MQLDREKIKKSAKIGSVLDIYMQIAMLVFLLGAAITNIVEAFSPFNRAAYIALTCIFAGFALIAFILYLVGGRYRKYVNRQIFNYCEEVTAAVLTDWLGGDSVALDINLSEDPNTAVFTVTDGKGTRAVYDLTCALALGTSGTAFIASCVCGLAARVKSDIAAGAKYKSVSYRITAGEGASAEQYLVKNGAPDAKELEKAEKEYLMFVKKYKK